ncbi:MAG: DUF502 domain-containing protein [Alphaproteobacteria bacterium]
MNDLTATTPPRSLLSRVQRYFFSGLLLLTPLILTLYLVVWFIDMTDSLVRPLFPSEWIVFHQYIPGYGLVILLIGSTLVGLLAKGFLGRYIIRHGEQLLEKMPIVRGLYSTIKQLSQAVLDKESSSFKEVGLIEYPRKDTWCLCFITGQTEGEVKGCFKEPMVNVFIPTTPNPTSGFLLFVPKKDIEILQMSVEEGLKMVISTGVITPKEKKLK